MVTGTAKRTNVETNIFKFTRLLNISTNFVGRINIKESKFQNLEMFGSVYIIMRAGNGLKIFVLICLQ